MQSPETGLFKIGVSNNPERRLQDLKSASGQAVSLVCALPDRKARKLEASLHDQLRRYSVLREWFSLPPSVLLPLIDALKARGECMLGVDPYIPVASIRGVDDVSILACHGLLPVAVDESTGEYLIEWFDDCGCALIKLANKEDGDNVWSLGARYRQRDSFIHSGWYLTENYTGIPSDTFCPMTDVRMLADPMTVSCCCHWSGHRTPS